MNKKNIWERATVAALVLGTAGWLTGGCGNETQEVSTNTLIPFASPFASVIPAGSITLTGAQVPTGTQTISVRYTLANGQTATTTGVQSAAGVITAPTPAGFTGTAAIQVTYQGTGGTLLGTQAGSANLLGNNQPVTTQLGPFNGPTPTPTPSPGASPSPIVAPSASPSPTPLPSASPTPTPVAGLTGLVVKVNGNAGFQSVASGSTNNLTATANSTTGADITNSTTFTVAPAVTGGPTGNITGSTYTAPTIATTPGAPPPPPAVVNITGRNGSITNTTTITINAAP